MLNKPHPVKGLSIRFPMLIPTKGEGFVHQGSGLEHRVDDLEFMDEGIPCKAMGCPSIESVQ